MTIDISKLSPEKQALLKARPDLLRSLEKEIPRKIQQFNAKCEKHR